MADVSTFLLRFKDPRSPYSSKQAKDEGKLRASAEQRHIEHKAVTENIGAKVIDLDLDQRRMETTLSDQHGLLTNIHHDTQGIIGHQASLAQLMKSQHDDTETQIRLTSANVQQLNTQMEALKTLEGSLVGFVSSESMRLWC